MSFEVKGVVSKYEGGCHYPQDRPGVLLILDFAGDSRNFSKSVNSDPPANSSATAGTLSIAKALLNGSPHRHYYKVDFPREKKARELLAKSERAAFYPQHLHHEPHGNAQFTAGLGNTSVQACIHFQPIYPITPQERAPARAISDPFVPDVQTFLTLIGREMSKQASKIPSWQDLFT
jgi:IGR protein motif.